ncbi:MAG: Porphobilinogen deaminase [Brockia lithotrophica]|uniref:Porphobilinogen deaminase n=1 Tax=Brockia lithotrophica TaxID=933949 RepID=A0A2T5G7G0_9BACL|nr:hydroxymethylbilane synthase [Brockia lithotrophica]PTQ52109.1 MAG: Porphobilinogen deaminase [Brockia lithotrophica]
MHGTLVLATRRSALALAQSRAVRVALLARFPDLRIELREVVTEGDRFLDRSLAEVGGKGLFVKAIEAELLAGRADFAVHSFKDLPAELPPGLAIVAVPPREAAEDVLVARRGESLAALPRGARVGTSSLRRAVLLRRLRPDLVVVPLRGNVDTRLRKLEAGEVDAVVLARAGLVRLGLAELAGEILDPREFIPAIAQGALALEAREEDGAVGEILRALDDPQSAARVRAERAFLRAVGGNCHVPIGAYTWWEGEILAMKGFVAAPDGTSYVEAEARGRDPDEVARTLAEALLARGAARALAGWATPASGVRGSPSLPSPPDAGEV